MLCKEQQIVCVIKYSFNIWRNLLQDTMRAGILLADMGLGKKKVIYPPPDN